MMTHNIMALPGSSANQWQYQPWALVFALNSTWVPQNVCMGTVNFGIGNKIWLWKQNSISILFCSIPICVVCVGNKIKKATLYKVLCSSLHTSKALEIELLKLIKSAAMLMQSKYFLLLFYMKCFPPMNDWKAFIVNLLEQVLQW